MWKEIILWHLIVTSSFNIIWKCLSPISWSQWRLWGYVCQIGHCQKSHEDSRILLYSICTVYLSVIPQLHLRPPSKWTDLFEQSMSWILVREIQFWCWKLSTHVPYKFNHSLLKEIGYCSPPKKKWKKDMKINAQRVRRSRNN